MTVECPDFVKCLNHRPSTFMTEIHLSYIARYNVRHYPNNLSSVQEIPSGFPRALENTENG